MDPPTIEMILILIFTLYAAGPTGPKKTGFTSAPRPLVREQLNRVGSRTSELVKKYSGFNLAGRGLKATFDLAKRPTDAMKDMFKKSSATRFEKEQREINKEFDLPADLQVAQRDLATLNSGNKAAAELKFQELGKLETRNDFQKVSFASKNYEKAVEQLQKAKTALKAAENLPGSHTTLQQNVKEATRAKEAANKDLMKSVGKVNTNLAKTRATKGKFQSIVQYDMATRSYVTRELKLTEGVEPTMNKDKMYGEAFTIKEMTNVSDRTIRQSARAIERTSGTKLSKEQLVQRTVESYSKTGVDAKAIGEFQKRVEKQVDIVQHKGTKQHLAWAAVIISLGSVGIFLADYFEKRRTKNEKKARNEIKDAQDKNTTRTDTNNGGDGENRTQ